MCPSSSWQYTHLNVDGASSSEMIRSSIDKIFNVNYFDNRMIILIAILCEYLMLAFMLFYVLCCLCCLLYMIVN